MRAPEAPRARPRAGRRIVSGLALGLLLALAPPLHGRAAGAPASPEPDSAANAPARTAADPDRLHAGQIGPDSPEHWWVEGPDAIGGLGDWSLGNGTLCATVSDPSHETVLSPVGGVLVDLAHCDRGDDQWRVLQPLIGPSRSDSLPVERVRAGRDEGAAWLVAEADPPGLAIETRFRLDLEEPALLRIRTRVRRVADGPRLRLWADVALHGTGSLLPFAASTRWPDQSPGLVHPPVDPDDLRSMIGALSRADLHGWVGGAALDPSAAYGMRLHSARLVAADGSARPLPALSIVGESFPMMGVLVRPFWRGGGEPRVGLFELGQAVFFDLRRGERLEIEREMWMGERPDLASVLDRVYEGGGARVHARVRPARAVLELRGLDGGVRTLARSDARGHFSFRAPPGRHLAVVRGEGGGELEREIEVPPHGAVALAPFRLPVPAVLDLPTGSPMRLVFLGLGGSGTPRLRDDLLGARVGERALRDAVVSNDLSLAGVPGDPGEIALPAGRYRILATRGPEFSVEETVVTLDPGERRALEIPAPRRVLETPGWVSADLHVHALPSDDTAFPLEARIASLVAEGLDVAVSTEHDRIADYAPVIRRMGLAGRLASLVGNEVTGTAHSGAVPFSMGHSNVFPLEPRPRAYRDGALRGEGVRLRELAEQVRGLPGRRLLQLNHPRPQGLEGDRGAFFTHLGVAGEAFDPTRPLSASPNRVLLERRSPGGLRDLDFDAVELLNGPSMRRYALTRADWLSLLLQGERRTATANSDTHRADEIAGVPRNYVALEPNGIADFREEAFVEALRRGASFGTTGPLLDVALEGVAPGGLFSGRAGRLSVGVRAAEWVPVSTLVIRIDGTVRERVAVERGERVERALDFSGDAFVTVEVRGRPGERYAAVLPGFEPIAFSNPIFVDGDGDGSWSAPGLPARLPLALRDPVASLEADAAPDLGVAGAGS